ncbi:MAG: hypothetical protein R6V85_12395 [Polyangia bacterium]
MPRRRAEKSEQMEPGPGVGGFGGACGEHEFGPEEDAVISKAAFWARALGAVMFVQAAFDLLSSFNLLGAGISIAIGIFFFLGGGSLRKVVDTSGQDVSLMMTALHKIGNAFLTRIIVTSIAVGLGLIVALVALLVLAA